MQLNTPAR